MDRITVLIADDEPAVRESLATVVGSDPELEVVGTASDAEAAIELAASSQPDVALVDVRMPGGGPRAAREISLRCPPTRVVALSAFEDRLSVLTMIRAGARSYVGKAATNEEILRAIHTTVAGHQALSATAMDEVYRAVAQAAASQQPRSEAELERDRILRLIRRQAVDFAFQPIAEIDSLRVVGIEAFARFRTVPRRPPHLWFALAEELGLLHELELVSVGVALSHLERLPERCYLSLNVTHETARSREFARLVDGSDPRRIVLELTERSPLEDEALSDALSLLRARGVRIAIDDAGRGVVSLRHVVRVAPEIIKLHPSITADIASDPTRQALVSSILSFAFDLGSAVVAKGVESARELATLARLHVPQAQGYHLARPSRLPTTPSWGRTTL